MATTGPLYPGTVATEAGPSGDDDWVNPGNISADDNTQAVITAASFDAGDDSFRLKATNFGFAAAGVPVGASIDGITVEIQRSNAAGAASDSEVRLYDSTGTLVGSNKAIAGDWPVGLTTQTYGGAADTWAAGLDAADIRSANFGVAFIANADAANTDIGVDFIRVTITHTGGATDVTVTPSPVTIPLAIPTPVVRGLSPYSAIVHADGPLRYYRLGEPSGTTAQDVMGVADGTYQNTPTLGVTGAVVSEADTAVTLDGATEFVSIPDAADLDFTTGPLSIEAWIKFTGVNGTFGDTIYGKGTLQPFFWLNTSDVLVFSKADEGDILSGGTISDTNWHHVVAVYHNGVAGEIYLDGVAVGGAVTDRTFVANSTAAAFGSKFGSSATDTWHGSLDEVAVYNRVLSGAEVLEHYNAGISSPVSVTPSPVAIPIVIPTPSIRVTKVVTPSSLAIPLVIPTPSVRATKVVTPSPVAIPLAFPTPSVRPDRRIAPDPVVVVLDFPAITLDVGGGVTPVTVTPDPVALVLAIPAPALHVDRILSPSPVAVPLVIPTPTIRVGATVSPGPVAIPLVIPTPSLQVGTRVTPDPVVITLAFPSPAVSAGAPTPPGFLDELIELAIAGDVVTVEELDGGSAGVVIVVTIAGVEVDAGGVLELDVEG